MGGPQTSGDGSLVIYSARAQAVTDLNAEEWRWNNDFGKNEFLNKPAHTDYTIYTRTGEVFQHVRNAQDVNDETPTLVTLPAGAYRVEPEALNCDGNRVAVVIPVVVKGGQTTIAHLEGGWRPLDYKDTEVAKLPCGRIIGWRAAEGEFASGPMPQVN